MPRPRTERTRAIAAFCQEHPELTGVAIAERFGVTRQWISLLVHRQSTSRRRALKWSARRRYPISLKLTCTCCGASFVRSGKLLTAYLIHHAKRPYLGTNCGSCRGHGARKMTCLGQRKAPAVAGA